MTPTTFGEIQRITRLTLIQSLFLSVVSDDQDNMPGLEVVNLSARLSGDEVVMSIDYYGPNGTHLGGLGL